MGGSEQPYLYDPPASRNTITYPYSDFNPRAATQAHYAAMTEQAERRKRKAAQEGKPLINFNQHPDSYMIVGQPTTNHEPMHANTKARIVWTRWIQFGFRLIQEVGALGILVCVICLKMKNNGAGWIIRVAPAWDSVITMYAIYHLLRPAKGRTPSTSASYHFFALFMDTGLIPFYIFIALFANQNYNLQVGVDGRWTSFFSTNFATTTVIFSTFIASIVVASLHLVSVGIDLYLIVMFRKIARLPPDMNPLEDNLTGSISGRRTRSQKHKYKNSEMTVDTVSTDISEKKNGYYSISTLAGDDSRLSTAKGPEVRTIPWGHSRMDSDNSYSPHNPNSARVSRQQYDGISLQQGPYSARSSRHDVGAGHRSRAGSVLTETKSQSAVDFADAPADAPVVPLRNARHGESRPDSFVSNQTATPDRMQAAPSKSFVQAQQRENLLNDNWFVYDDDPVADLGTPGRQGNPAPPYSVQQNRSIPAINHNDSFEHQPLKMNPPTPPLQQQEYAGPDDQEEAETGVARTLTVISSRTAGSSVYSESAPELGGNGRPNNGTPKGKYYGDLASATRGVRGAVPLSQTNFPKMEKPGMGDYGVPTPQQSRSPSPKKGGRVISRTGVDIADAGVYAPEHSSGYGLRGRRDVSGKIAEEGRGGAWR